MTCTPFRTADGISGIACTRGQKTKRCATCQKSGAQLLCDGCDRPLCGACHVSPVPAHDFCPACARPVFVTWLRAGELGLVQVPEERQARRMAFRTWARENPEAFDCVPLTSAGMRAVSP